jgi:hypothetical protein
MNMDKKDLISFFQELRIMYGTHFYNNIELLSQVERYLGKDEVDVLDIKRMYRFLDKNVKKDADGVPIDDELSVMDDLDDGEDGEED